MGSLAEDRPRAERLADILKALAHPARLRIVAVLCDRKETVIGIAERLDIKQAIVSQQLRILRMSGLVAATRENGFSAATAWPSRGCATLSPAWGDARGDQRPRRVACGQPPRVAFSAATKGGIHAAARGGISRGAMSARKEGVGR